MTINDNTKNISLFNFFSPEGKTMEIRVNEIALKELSS
jgi:hypothetical protein